MYERFTDRARRAMMLANQEAVRHGHEYLGVEHIFCGLLSERGGVAASALKSLSVDFDAMLSAVRGTMSETNQITTGKLPQTPNAKILIHRSIEIAKDAGHNYIGTEHLFLSLIRVCENSRPELYAILKSHKATQEFFWLSVIDTLKSVEADPQGVFTQTTDSVLEQWNFQLALGSECQVVPNSVPDNPQTVTNQAVSAIENFRNTVLNVLAEEMEAAKKAGHSAAWTYLKRVIRKVLGQDAATAKESDADSAKVVQGTKVLTTACNGNHNWKVTVKFSRPVSLQEARDVLTLNNHLPQPEMGRTRIQQNLELTLNGIDAVWTATDVKQYLTSRG